MKGKENMKTLANCSMAEFLRQSNIIRKAVAEYLEETDILSFRRNLPELPEGISEEEKKVLLNEQAKKNISDMLDTALEEYTEETIRILGLLCFANTAEEAEALEPVDLLDVALDLLQSERVISFFTRLMQSGKKNTETSSQK